LTGEELVPAAQHRTAHDVYMLVPFSHRKITIVGHISVTSHKIVLFFVKKKFVTWNLVTKASLDILGVIVRNVTIEIATMSIHTPRQVRYRDFDVQMMVESIDGQIHSKREFGFYAHILPPLNR
jgi:hypothetical protein